MIDCPVSGVPQPKVTWYKNGDLLSIEIDSNITFRDDGRRLKILTARVSDAALYTCVGSNDAGNTSRDFKVEVYGKISFKYFKIGVDS